MVTVSNSEQYNSEKTYYLHVTEGVLSVSNKPLGSEVVMKFVTGNSENEFMNEPSSTVTSGSSGGTSSSGGDETTKLDDILSEYGEKFRNLQAEAEGSLNDLVESAVAEKENGATEFELISKYVSKVQELESSMDNSFNSIYQDLVNDLEENDYSASEAEHFKEEYEKAKEDQRAELLERFGIDL